MGQNNQNIIKTDNEIEIMRNNGHILDAILSDIKNNIKPNVDTMDLENLFIDLCDKNKVNPSCKGYRVLSLPPFVSGLCISINDECVHCAPKKGKIIKEGDIVTVDTVIDCNGLFVDSAFCIMVGEVSFDKKQLVLASKKALDDAISLVRNDVKIGVISNQISKTAGLFKMNVLKNYTGHGIGKNMHEFPMIPCYGSKYDGPKLKSNMTICIESLLCSKDDVVLDNSYSWNTKMKNGYFAQFEHTVLVKDNGYEILTMSL